jgi:chromate reductase
MNNYLEKTMKILGIAGSLRKGSYNKSVIKAALDMIPSGIDMEIFDLAGLPMFNQDFEAKLPAEIKVFKSKIKAADAILFSTPEYNYSVPGVLKNAIDCGSRPYGDNSWEGKPCGIMSASISMTGGIRAQYHLRQMMVFLNMFPVNRPEVVIPDAMHKFDEHGKITDQHTKDKIKEMIEAVVEWTKRLENKR